jgi:hypothetical protein
MATEKKRRIGQIIINVISAVIGAIAAAFGFTL